MLCEYDNTLSVVCFVVNVATHPMAQNWVPAAVNVASSAKRKPGNDPNRPKRPTSAYFYFVQLEREEAAKRGEKITRVCKVFLIYIYIVYFASMQKGRFSLKLVLLLKIDR